MNRRKLKYRGRKKALFGSEEAAILGAAAITSASTIAAAATNASATKEAAKSQADATKEAAKQQAESITAQNENNTQLQENSIEFTKEQNEENRTLQKDIQTNLQILAGKQNTNDKLEAAKIQVKNGGSMRNKLKNQQAITSLRGDAFGNMGFQVTDGGGVVPVGITPEGFALYEIMGNDHDHYHKTKSGKSKTGVGIKFNSGNVIEGEGNQNSNQGEYMLTTPTDTLFISKHSIKGFNPSKAVNEGMHPLHAYNIQERLKAIYDIPDSGKANDPSKYTYNLPVGNMRRELGGNTTMSTLSPTVNTPNLSLDPIAPISTGVAYAVLNNNNATTTPEIPSKAKLGTSLRAQKGKGGNWNLTWQNGGTNLLASGINSLGNIGGAFISGMANNSASKTIADANNQAANIIANAYSQMKGVDENAISKSDYEAPHVMATVRAPIINTSAQRAMAERSLQRRLTQINKNSLSGAAAQDRASTAETNYIDTMNQIYSNAEAEKEKIKQQNANTITNVANENANRDLKANEQYAASRLNLLEYNNNIENAKLAGTAQAYSNAITGTGTSTAALQQTNGLSWANALNNSGNSISNSLSTIQKEKTDTNNAYLGASMESQVNAAIATGDLNRMIAIRNSLEGITNPTQKAYYDRLTAAIDAKSKKKSDIKE